MFARRTLNSLSNSEIKTMMAQLKRGHLSYNLSCYILDTIKYAVFRDVSDSQNLDVTIHNGMLLITIHEPAPFIVDSKFYDQLYDLLSVILWPVMTLIRPLSMQLVSTRSDMSEARALAFPYYVGSVQRLRCTFDQLNQLRHGSRIPIMGNLTWDYHRSPHAIITGVSGSGKSYAITNLLRITYRIPGSSIILFDPKVSVGARWARDKSNIRTVIPDFSHVRASIGNAYLEQINRTLAQVEAVMYKRQYYLYKNAGVNATYNKDPIFIYFDELASVTSAGDVSPKLKKELWGHLSRITLLGREANVQMILSLQRPTADALPVQVRDNCSFKVLLGPTTLANLNLLFSNLSSLPFVPNLNEKGSGLCTIQGSEDYVMPLKTPTIIRKEGYYD